MEPDLYIFHPDNRILGYFLFCSDFIYDRDGNEYRFQYSSTRSFFHLNTRILGRFFYQHCTFQALSCINTAAREVTLERNRATDFCVPVQYIQQFSVSFIHLQSSEKNRSMIELSPLFLNSISSINVIICKNSANF